MNDNISLAIERGEAPPSLLMRIAFGFFIAALAWAPFPLGSNRPWSTNIMTVLVALCWCLWGMGTWNTFERTWAVLRPLQWPLVLGFLALVWACVQICVWVPNDWDNNIWTTASLVLHKHIVGTVSINPWRTQAEMIKLVTYAGVLILAFLIALRDEWANRMLNAVITITAAYAAYALFLHLVGLAQYQIFYLTPLATTGFLSGPFVLHNSYATFSGLGSLAAGLKLFDMSRGAILIGRDFRISLLSIVNFAFGSGVRYIVAFVLTFSTLVASASRAGFLATVVALISTILLAAVSRGRRPATRWALCAMGTALLMVIGLVLVNGDTLVLRLKELVDAGTIDDVRSTLWAAAGRMISSHPLMGLGLGTFQDAYPLYADRVLPYTIDKAHNDYLELAAGIGIPAAVLFWIALTSLVIRCLKGFLARRRNRLYALLGFGSSILVAVHSVFDFSLQIPAVAMLFATLLGLGLAQSFRASTRTI